MTTNTKIKRSTVNGIEQYYTCYRTDGSAYDVPSYYPARGHSMASAAASIGCRLVARRDGQSEADGIVVGEVHDAGVIALLIPDKAA